MTKLFTISLALIFSLSAISQKTLFSDDFESYTVGQGLAAQSANWETWSSPNGGGTEDALISDSISKGGSKSLLIDNDKDMVFQFGNMQNGHYQVKFDAYISDSNGLYFNIEHQFAVNWAFDIIFNESNQIKVVTQFDTNIVGSYNHNQWYEIKLDININSDTCVFFVDNAPLDTIIFSESPSGITSNKLGCINIYGLNAYPATYIDNSYWFLDDFEFIEITPALNDAKIDINISSITTLGANEIIQIGNNGQVDLEYRVYAVYDNHATFSGNNTNNVLTHCTDNLPIYASYGWPTGDTARFLARFYPNSLKNYIGLKIDSVVTYTERGYLNNEARVVIYNRGSNIDKNIMGNIIYTESFSNVPANSIYGFTLSQANYVTGEELAFGMEVQSISPDSLLAPVEYSDPAVGEIDANYYYFNGSYIPKQYNIYLKAYLSGTLWPKWISIINSSGSISAANSTNSLIKFTTTDLTAGETYTAKLVIASNDEDSMFVEIPITLDISNGLYENSKIGLMSYPNPTNDFFYLQSDENIELINVYDISGKKIFSHSLNSTMAKIDLSNVNSGIYIIEVFIDSQKISKKVIVK